MSESKHTPGPWEAMENGDVSTYHGIFMVPGEDRATIRANARLIAAAPDLLAALEAIVKEFGPSYGLDDSPGAINKASKIARAAIAKARNAGAVNEVNKAKGE